MTPLTREQIAGLRELLAKFPDGDYEMPLGAAGLFVAMHNALPALLDIAEAVARAEIVDAEEDGFISTYAPMNAKRVIVLPLAGEGV